MLKKLGMWEAFSFANKVHAWKIGKAELEHFQTMNYSERPADYLKHPAVDDLFGHVTGCLDVVVFLQLGIK